MDATDQPMYHVDQIYMYPLQSTDNKNLSFNLLTGETIIHSGNSVDGAILITNYRLYLQSGKVHYHIPLGLIEFVEPRELFYVHVGCKDARTYRCTFENNEECMEWYNRILKASDPPRQVRQLFAFYHCVWSKQKDPEETLKRLENQKNYIFNKEMFEKELARLQFEGDSWRISKVNDNFKLCPTYPPYLLVPSCINDDTLESVAKFRSSRRIPAAVWRHARNGAVIARCSQPEVGWLGWRSTEDEELIKAISAACNFDRSTHVIIDKESNLSHSPGSLHSDESLQITGEINNQQEKKSEGGGCECPDYYPNCDIQFMNLANIHSIRKSFHALRLLCTSSADQTSWFSQLEGTRWLMHMSGLMKAAVTLVTAVERDERPVLVHCSDGWDRTPQIVALAELLLDPYYRTVDGFRTLIEREWLAFGHKFADRCGQSTGSDDQNERCPVFLQWLDCVHQVVLQFPCSFEFSQPYLVKLVQHTYSNLFGTFFCNTQQDRLNTIYDKTFSVWDFLNSPCFRNNLYAPSSRGVLWPQCNVRDLKLWSEVYLGTMETNFNAENGIGYFPCPPELSPRHMTKTRSYGDLKNAGDHCANNQYRRCSDPSINCDTNLTILASDIPHDPDVCVQGEASDTLDPQHDDHRGPDFYPSDLEDTDCRQDCLMFETDTDNLTDDQIDGLDRADFNGKPLLEGAVLNGDSKVNFLDENVISWAQCDRDNGDCGENGVGCAVETFLNVERSVETSTETLVSEHICSSSPKEINGFEKVQSPVDNSIMTDGCAQDLRVINMANRSGYSPTSHFTASSGWDKTLHYLVTEPKKFLHSYQQHNLDEDGLIPLRCVIQERLVQIIEEQKRKMDLLEKELYVVRQNLMKQSCHRCNHVDVDRQDDNSSVVESVCSTSEGQASAGESQRSDMSWVAVEEASIADCHTLWVPDHAVSRCTGCGTEFWLGRRRHHCRKCGNIFCADCSENSTPLPSEQLYNPVRVCTGCYSELRRSCSEIPNQCKHTNAQTTNANPQIAASSN
ncbi:hypothetical protein NQ317_018251 [Molorchus minor]|uniref:phosphatidylinositol-3,5-bisphosphate 3-phosphatase n=1 Tax=Molorchus minor TaxID=1323400 RepID=A0ABQ9K6N9_9CUCU|nr:hypothetical protein NQ317_018251 [Molorchus minor]